MPSSTSRTYGCLDFDLDLNGTTRLYDCSCCSPTTIPVTPALWCTPHTPIAHVANSYFGLPAPSGPSIDYPPQVVPAHDDHGNTIQQVGLSVEMTGPGGTITLTHGGPTNDVVLRGWGDFNGDGRTDLLVDVVYGQPDDATLHCSLAR